VRCLSVCISDPRARTRGPSVAHSRLSLTRAHALTRPNAAPLPKPQEFEIAGITFTVEYIIETWFWGQCTIEGAGMIVIVIVIPLVVLIALCLCCYRYRSKKKLSA
jgi:hypothetical protein